MVLFGSKFSKKFASDSLWSLAGNGTSVIAGLATVKIVSAWIDSEAYGQASLLLGVVALLNGLLVGPLMAVHLRLYFDYLKRGMAHWYASVFNAVFIVTAVAASCIYIVIALAYMWTGEGLYWNHAVPVILLILAQPYLSAIANYLEAHREQRRLATLNSLQRGLYPCFLLLLLPTVILPTDAVVVAQGLVVLFLLAVFRPPTAQRASATIPDSRDGELFTLRTLVKDFGWALPLSYFVMWLVTTGDRYLLQHFASLGDVGIYTMNYGFWSMPFLFLNGWLEILTRPIIYTSAAKGDWPRVKTILVSRSMTGMLLSVVGTVLLYVLAEPIGKVMLGSQYWVGTQLVMTIAAAHCFYVFGYSIIPVFLAAKRPNMILLATSCAAVCNVAANVVLIPSFGLWGAAITTFVSYLLWSAILAPAAYLLMRTLVQSDQ